MSSEKSQRAVVLLSGGLDSVSNLYLAHEQYLISLCLTFNYGQRAFDKEARAAKYFSKILAIPHLVVDVSSIFTVFGRSSLVDRKLAVPVNQEISIDDPAVSLASAKSVWVPNRNGIFLNLAAGYAESLDAEIVIPGFNIEEAQTFPDNSQDFLNAMTYSLSYSTANKVRAECLTTAMNKTEIVALMKDKNLPFNELWPCYLAEEKWCGECESCKRAQRALANNQVELHNFKGQ